MCVSMCACAFMYIWYQCLCLYAYVCICACVYVCKSACVCMSACVSVWMYILIVWMDIHMHAMYIRMQARTYICTYIST